MVERLVRGGLDVIAWDSDRSAVKTAEQAGAGAAGSIDELAGALGPKKIIWTMVPAGPPTDEVIDEASTSCRDGDVIIDGGNSNYRDTMARAGSLRSKGIHMLDAGTSGGIWGLKEGYCLMIGGEKDIFETAEPLFKALSPPGGYAHVGPNGAGHFVKMVHNGIEYGLLQAYGEGFEILKASRDFDLDLTGISALWNRGSVIRSWLLELLESALDKNPGLEDIAGYVDDSGEGRWTVAEAINRDVPAPVITLSLIQRFASRQDESFSAKIIAALRREFGGHPLKKTD